MPKQRTMDWTEEDKKMKAAIKRDKLKKAVAKQLKKAKKHKEAVDKGYLRKDPITNHGRRDM